MASCLDGKDVTSSHPRAELLARATKLQQALAAANLPAMARPQFEKGVKAIIRCFQGDAVDKPMLGDLSKRLMGDVKGSLHRRREELYNEYKFLRDKAFPAKTAPERP